MGCSEQYSLTPIFFEGTFNGYDYTDILQKHAVPQMGNDRKLPSTIFQQDGVPPHYSLMTRGFISSVFSLSLQICFIFVKCLKPMSPSIRQWVYCYIFMHISQHRLRTMISDLAASLLNHKHISLSRPFKSKYIIKTRHI